MHDRPVVEVVAAVIEHDGLVLACRRRSGKAAGGKWEFPGGKIEVGELGETALARELREELDIAITIRAHLRADDTSVGNQTIRLSCFLAAISGDMPSRSTDHDEMRWLRTDDLDQLDWAAPDLPMVRQLVQLGFSPE
jgi:8-oxo-dGTP diphosphatase